MTGQAAAVVAERAAAKVNLALHVIGRCPDGYHLLDSLVVFADVADVVTVAADAEGPILDLSGPFARQLGGLGIERNLAVRAACHLAKAVGRSPEVRIAIDKQLPVEAGIGGGSADAAAALRALGRLWGSALTTLEDAAPHLGADVPACLLARSCRVTGIGEVLEPVSLPPLPAVLANPGRGVATAAVFARYREIAAGFDPEAGAPPAGEDPDRLLSWLRARTNGLSDAARALEPAIGEVLAALEATGPRLARLSGSGPTCFALYRTTTEAEEAARLLAGRHPGWWVVPARLGEPAQGEGSG